LFLGYKKHKRMGNMGNDDVTLLLIRWSDCHFCKGLDGADGPLAAAAKGLVAYKEAERAEPFVSWLNSLRDPDVNVRGYPTIVLAHKNCWVPLHDSVETKDTDQVRRWIRIVLPGILST
jgi:hypothetical protein